MTLGRKCSIMCMRGIYDEGEESREGRRRRREQYKERGKREIFLALKCVMCMQNCNITGSLVGEKLRKILDQCQLEVYIAARQYFILN